MSQDMTRWAAMCYAQLERDMESEHSTVDGAYSDFATEELRNTFIEAAKAHLFLSMKFVLPEEISNEPSLKVEGFDEFLSIVKQNPMPYEFVAISCFARFSDGESSPYCCTYWHDEENEQITIQMYLRVDDETGFWRLPAFITLDINKGNYTVYGTMSKEAARLNLGYGEREALNSLNSLAQTAGTQAMGGLATLLMLLSCSNVSEQDVPISKLKRDRLRKKKLPVFEHKTLYIEDVKSSRVDRGGTSSPKRQHHRRGHIRRLSNGNQVWVRPCLVGDPALGFVSKDYSFKSNGRASA